MSSVCPPPPIRRRGPTLATALASGLVALAGAGCGGATRSVTVVTAPVATAPAASAPNAADTQAQTAPPGNPSPSVGPPPSGPPLPGGAATVAGSYRLTYVAYSPPGYNLNDRDYTGDTSTWYAQTTCVGGACTLQLRRALHSGGYKTYALHQQDPANWGGTFAGVADACSTPQPQPVRERVGLHVSHTATLGGVPTATGFDVYVAQSGSCRTDGKRIQATARWRGARVGG